MSSIPLTAVFDALPEHERPDVLDAASDAGVTQLRLKLRRELPWFDGHFPGRPILPGVAQVHLAAVAARALSDPGTDVLGTGRLKFQQPVLPDTILSLTLKTVSSGVRFEFATNQGVYSSGSLKLSSGGAA